MSKHLFGASRRPKVFLGEIVKKSGGKHSFAKKRGPKAFLGEIVKDKTTEKWFFAGSENVKEIYGKLSFITALPMLHKGTERSAHDFGR